ncbi:gag polymerase env [Lasallia pustulata]|uniref:Gag polymerase env n=1 Tax=Lasallia pustulata TaxID=136370 RepID=A0A1W5D1M0_9LECA|nr:gag polymerase env [Lasallia pustulata]
MDPERIRAVEEWLPPQDVHQLQVFLGFANFFRRFIKNYSRIAAPLLNLLKTGKNKKEIGVKVRQTNVVPPTFPLSETALEAFKALKEAFTSAPLLRYFDENKPMRVETDTSAFAIGGILTQQFEINGHLHWLPVAYYSKKLLDTETRYGTGEQELFAIVKAMHRIIGDITVELKWAEKLAEYDFNVTYREGKKNPADGLSRRPDYELPKASTTSTAAETVRQSFRLGSNDYKPVQEKLYTLAVMTLRPRRPSVTYLLEKQAVMVMLRYDETTSYPTSIWTAVRLEHQQSVTYLLEKQAVMVMLRYDETMLYLTSIWTTVRLEHQQSVTYLLEKQAVMVMLQYDETTSYPTSIWTAVRLEHQQSVTYLLEKQAVMVMLRYDETTSYPTSIWTAVRLEHQQSVTYMLEKQAVMVMLWYDETTSYPTSLWTAADADAMDIDDTVDNDPIGLQIEAGASDETVEALWLVATRTPIGGEATAYTKMSIEELKRAICAEQSHDSLVRRVRQGLAIPIDDRPNLAGPEMANAVPGTANMAMNMAATMASIWSRWQEIDDVVYYNGKIYVPQNTALRNTVISRYHDDLFAGHFGKSRTAKLI